MVIMTSKKQKMQVSASSPNFSMVETDVTTIKLSGLSPNTQVITLYISLQWWWFWWLNDDDCNNDNNYDDSFDDQIKWWLLSMLSKQQIWLRYNDNDVDDFGDYNDDDFNDF